MSSGQRPRTPEYFPRMKVRGGRRRAHKVVYAFADLAACWPAVVAAIGAAFERFVAGIIAVGGALGQWHGDLLDQRVTTQRDYALAGSKGAGDST